MPLSTTGPSPLEHWESFFPRGTRVVALPSWNRPRLLVPVTTLVQRASASAFYPAYRLPGRLYHWLLRAKAVLALNAKSSASDASSEVSEFVQDVFPRARVRAVQVGMRGSARKCTVQLADQSDQVIGYLKCAESPLARRRLKDEFNLLQILPRGAGPTVLKYGSLGAFEGLLLTVVPGEVLRPVLPPSRQVRDFTASLEAGQQYTFDSHPWVQRHAHRADEMPGLLEALAERTWPLAIQHGDFAPWNVIQATAGTLTAIDWEHGVQAGFPGLDLAQFMLQVAALIRRWPPARAREYATSQLLADDHLRLRPREAAALVGIAAFRSYENTAREGHAPTDWAQVWRRAVWEDTIRGL